MKKILLPCFCLIIALSTNAQLKVKAECDPFYVDILNGTVNTVKPNHTPGEIQQKLPCFSGYEEEGAAAKCGGSISFKGQDIVFYTQRNIIEIGSKFKGKMSIPLLGASRTKLFPLLGSPQLKDDNWEAFQTAYGILILYYTAGKVNRILMSSENATTIQLCQ